MAQWIKHEDLSSDPHHIKKKKKRTVVLIHGYRSLGLISQPFINEPQGQCKTLLKKIENHR